MDRSISKIAIGSLAAVAILVLVAGVSFAHGGCRGGQRGGFPGVSSCRLLDRLGATEEQKAPVREVQAVPTPERRTTLVDLEEKRGRKADRAMDRRFRGHEGGMR